MSAKCSPKNTAKGSQPKPKKMPEGKSTMDRIKTGGNKVESVSKRALKRYGNPKGY